MRVSALVLGVCLLQPAFAHAQAAAKAQPPAAAAKPQPPAAERKEIKVPEKVLTTYVGVYELTPERTLEITLENGSLHGQPTGQEKRQMFAESPTKFFLKTSPIDITFIKDAKGKVTGLTMQREGQPARELTKTRVLSRCECGVLSATGASRSRGTQEDPCPKR